MQRTHQLGRYHLLDRLAFGGMAEIYRAKTFDEQGRAHVVAIKRILAHLAEDEEFIQMLVDEAKLASMLKHPNIARVYEFARAHGEYFIAMEHVDGKDARTILERCRSLGQALPIEHAAYIAAEVGSALHAAHALVDVQDKPLRVVHRDVSPSNVLCAYAGDIKLCDFGIAKATLSRVQTKTGVIKGKVKYMSPEQAMGRKLDHRSDIFSLGAVLYELLTRIPPFTASSEMELLLKVRDAQVRPIQEVDPKIPDALARVVHRALSRSRSARYQSAQDMADELWAYLEEAHPALGRTDFGRWLRRMFEQDIERELRRLEDFVLTAADPADVGENLIADALGPDAEYSKFTSAVPAEESFGAIESQVRDPFPAGIDTDHEGMQTRPRAPTLAHGQHTTDKRAPKALETDRELRTQLTGARTPTPTVDRERGANIVARKSPLSGRSAPVSAPAPSATRGPEPRRVPTVTKPPLGRGPDTERDRRAPGMDARTPTPTPIDIPRPGPVSVVAQPAPRSRPATRPPPQPDPARPRVTPEPPRAADPGEFHEASTQILDPRARVELDARPAPPTRPPAPPKKRPKRHFPGSPGGRDPQELDPAIHEAPTMILDPDGKKPR